MNVDFKGYGENVATFIADSGVAVGNIVKLSDNFKVVNAASGDDFIGVCVGVRSGYAAVQLSGYVEVPASARQNGYRGGKRYGGCNGSERHKVQSNLLHKQQSRFHSLIRR